MAQSALTVTPPSPTPPTNFACAGVTGPNPPNFRRNAYANPFNMDAGGRPQSPYGVNPNPPPYQSGAPTSAVNGAVFIANQAALTAGTSANDTAGPNLSTAATGAGGTGVHATVGTYPGSGTLLTDVSDVGPVPASTSVAHEGAGTEVLVTQTYNVPQIMIPGVIAAGTGWNAGDPGGPLRMVSDLGNFTGVASPPNAQHASSLSPLVNPTLTTITPTTAVSGSGTTALTAVTGVGFTPQSTVYANGVAIPTVFVSSTTLTATMPKKATAGTWPITVVTGGVVTTLPQTFTWT
jgi:IPT/TIG domain